MAVSFQTDSAGYLYVTPNPPTGTSSATNQGTVAAGSTAVGYPLAVGVPSDAANGGAQVMQFLSSDLGKALKTNPEGQIATFTSGFQVTPATSATDIAMLIGSATKIVKLRRVTIFGLATTAAMIDVVGIKRSAADTGGTITGQTAVNHDSSDAVATAVCSLISANPSVGATGSKYGTMIWSKLPLMPAATTTLVNAPLVWNFGVTGERSMTLRGVADNFVVNLNGVQSSGQVMSIVYVWTEE